MSRTPDLAFAVIGVLAVGTTTAADVARTLAADIAAVEATLAFLVARRVVVAHGDDPPEWVLRPAADWHIAV